MPETPPAKSNSLRDGTNSDIAPLTRSQSLASMMPLLLPRLLLEPLEMGTLRRFLRDENAATAIEYGLIAALVAVACIGVLSTLGTSLSATFTSIASNLTQTGS